MTAITITAAEAEKIVAAIVNASRVLNDHVIGPDAEDAEVTLGMMTTSVRAIDNGLFAACRIIREKQGR